MANGKYGDPMPDQARTRAVFITDEQGNAGATVTITGTVNTVGGAAAATVNVADGFIGINNIPTVNVGNTVVVSGTVNSVGGSGLATVNIAGGFLTATVNLGSIGTINVGNTVSVNATILTAPLDVQQSGANSWTVNVAGGFATVNVTKIPLTGSVPTYRMDVGTTAIPILVGNASRKGLVLINLSPNTVHFGIGQTAVVNAGITLKENGVWEMGEYSYSVATLSAISTGASSHISIQEFTG